MLRIGRKQPKHQHASFSCFIVPAALVLCTVDYWELLPKDFRDVQRSGTIWPDLSTLLEAIKPANH